jgi:hypothetical protein
MLTYFKFYGHGFLLDELAYEQAFYLFVPSQSSSLGLDNSTLGFEQQTQHFRLSNNTPFGDKPYKQLAGTFSQRGCIARSISFQPRMI